MNPFRLQISQNAHMRANITLHVTAADRQRLDALVADRNTPAKVVWRAEIILATADGLGTHAIMRRSGKSKPCVWRWQERFAAEGVEGLIRDRTRPGRKPPLPDEITRAGCSPRRRARRRRTPRTGARRSMAKAIGISHTSVQRIWREAGLKPHLTRSFKIRAGPLR